MTTQVHEALGCGLAAGGAVLGAEDARGLREGDARLLDVKKLLRLSGLVVLKALLPRQALGLFTEHEADRAAALALVDVERLLARQVEQQIAFSRRTAQHNLYRVYAAGVVLADADDLLVLRAADVQQLYRIKRSLPAYCKSAAFVAVEGGAVGPGLCFHVSSSYNLMSGNGIIYGMPM